VAEIFHPEISRPIVVNTKRTRRHGIEIHKTAHETQKTNIDVYGALEKSLSPGIDHLMRLRELQDIKPVVPKFFHSTAFTRQHGFLFALKKAIGFNGILRAHPRQAV